MAKYPFTIDDSDFVSWLDYLRISMNHCNSVRDFFKDCANFLNFDIILPGFLKKEMFFCLAIYHRILSANGRVH